MATANLTMWLLNYQRQYVINKIKKPLMKAIITLANRLQIEPDKENTVHPNSHVLIDVWNKFLEMEYNGDREPLFRAMKRIMIAEHEHDNYYRDRMQVLFELWLDEVIAGHWKPRSLDHPTTHWKVDPNIRGAGFNFIQSHYVHPLPKKDN